MHKAMYIDWSTLIGYILRYCIYKLLWYSLMIKVNCSIECLLVSNALVLISDIIRKD